MKIMRHFNVFLAGLFFSCPSVYADGYKTAGDGTVYTIEKLSQITESGVSKEGDIYTVSLCDTITAGDSFKMDEGITVRFSDDAQLVIQGKANLTVENGRTILTRTPQAEHCLGLDIQNDASVTDIKNIDFEYIGLRNYSTQGMNISHCHFSKHNGTMSAALFLGVSGAEFHVQECLFDSCQKAAIGGAANFSCNINIESCTFKHNSQANNNIPQINLSAAPSIVIKDCIIDGDSTRNMVGGIGVANWFGSTGMNASITDCTITNNRYGLTTMGIMDVQIIGNQIINNKFETNPNNGGSGISLYDPYNSQTAMVSGNRIEGSLWGITVIGCGNVNIGKTVVDPSAPDYNPGGNVFKNNGFDGMLYDLYNNSTNTVYAQGNIWNVNTQDRESIETVVYHKNDNELLGEVIFMPSGDTSDIQRTSHTNNTATSSVYNMRGMQISSTDMKSLPQGIYIINGKKTVIQ